MDFLPFLASKGRVFGWCHSACLSLSPTGPVQPKGTEMKVATPLPKCQIRAEFLKGEEHGGDVVGLGRGSLGGQQHQDGLSHKNGGRQCLALGQSLQIVP